MNADSQDLGTDRQSDALAAAILLAIDPVGLGGAVVRCAHGPDREAWLAHFRRLLPTATPQRRMPSGAGEAALLGGLDFAASLQVGRPVLQQGLLAQADGGVITLAMAERLPRASAALIAASLDTGEVLIERDGLGRRLPARFGLLALDEGVDEDEQVPASLRERLAFRVDEASLRGLDSLGLEAESVEQARARLPQVRVSEAMVQALCEAAQALGVDSLRGSLLALRSARASAAWDGREEVDAEDAALAARLVLAHRATRLPAPAPEQEARPEPAEALSLIHI